MASWMGRFQTMSSWLRYAVFLSFQVKINIIFVFVCKYFFRFQSYQIVYVCISMWVTSCSSLSLYDSA